jgi:hypothetical protein
MTRVATGGTVLAAIAFLLAVVGPVPGAVIDVFLLGVAGATIVYVKNRTDRHNAAVERGDIVAVQLERTLEIRPDVGERLLALGIAEPEVIYRFDGGWVVSGTTGVVLGEDGGYAFFDPVRVSAAWAASEYLSGRAPPPAR